MTPSGAVRADASRRRRRAEGEHEVMALSRPHAITISRAALAEVAHLTGKEAEKVISLRRDGEIWALEVDVVDLRRVPDSTDFLATYLVHLDDDGNVLDLRRTRRYVRAWLGDQDGSRS
jgi:hypothetical protein